MQQRQKTSKIWLVTKNELEKLVQESSSIGEVLAYFGLKNHGGNPTTLKRRLIADNINYDNLLKSPHRKSSRIRYVGQPLSSILTKNSQYSRASLKKRLIQENIIPYRCSLCKIESIWNHQLLVLQLDHINGINNDNRIENLRFLCPNCHSQTNNFTSKNRQRQTNISKISNIIPTIGWRNQPRFKKRKVVRPTLDVLLREVNELGYCAIGRKYGVTDNAIRKWIKFAQREDYKPILFWNI